MGGSRGLGRCWANRGVSLAEGAGGHQVVKGNVLGGGVSTGAEWYERGEAAKLLHADGVFFSGVAGVRGCGCARSAAGGEGEGASLRVAGAGASARGRLEGRRYDGKGKNAGETPAVRKTKRG